MRPLNCVTVWPCAFFLKFFFHGPPGYVYLVFESDKSVRSLLQDCTEDLLHPEGYSEYYFKMSSRRMRCKDVRWALGVDFVASDFFFFFLVHF